MLTQVIVAGVNILYKVSYNVGFSLRILVVYQFIVATICILPFALIVDRSTRPALTWRIAGLGILAGVFGGALGQNIFAASFAFASVTYLAAISNLSLAVTYMLAIVFSSSTVLSTIYAISIERDWSAWYLAQDAGAITYSGILASGLSVMLATWCARQQGPVFVSATSPLALIFTALMCPTLLHEEIHLGSAETQSRRDDPDIKGVNPDIESVETQLKRDHPDLERVEIQLNEEDLNLEGAEIQLTNDGAKILEQMDVDNQIANSWLNYPEVQIMKLAEWLLERGIHPIQIAEGYEMASRIAIEHLKLIAKMFDFRPTNNEHLEHSASRIAIEHLKHIVR
ncbi:WAT1-related protein At1g25270-like [Durio zibethinus]|uniref:WAT1-related protein At1g25270-like n=1 Tax=Durio zibethinus TaxID=66656 RepID=A0A6P5ZHQ5_DURZI|nr:WAT1-related protein At1g25270-like [Durio zibethinus]